MSESEDLHDSSIETFSAGSIYTLETVEKITRISRDRIVIYYQSGLVAPVKRDERDNLFFDDEAIHKLRRIAFLLSEYGVNPDGLKKFFALIDELERLREEVRFLRQK
jgi:DNA-binding transcriptional MerR regulator